MTCDELRDDQWGRPKDLMPGGTKGRRGPRTDDRLFVGALLFMARFGTRWCDLPEAYGHYRGVRRRYDRRIEMGVLDAILAALMQDADLEWLMIGSTIVRAVQHAAGAAREKGGRMPGAWAGSAEARAPRSMPPVMLWDVPFATSLHRADATTPPWPKGRRQTSLPGIQRRRADLPQAEAVQPRRHAMRRVARQRHGLREARRRRDMAETTKHAMP